jgi:hypothetical protein
MNTTTATSRIPLSYWRAALAEVSLLHPEVPPENKAIEIGIVNGMWQVTKAEPEIRSWVAEQFSASKTRVDERTRTVPLVLINARLSKSVSHGVKYEAGDIHAALSLLCIPCLLDRAGALLPDPDRHPWIPRDLLEPTVKTVSIGQLDQYDQFVSGLLEKATSLDDTLRTAAALFAAVTGAKLPLLPADPDAGEALPDFAVEGQKLVSAWHALPYEPPIVARHLIRLYDQIIGDTPHVPLLDNLSTTVQRPSHPPLTVQEAEHWYADTVGHIDRHHPLSPSQREAMVELSRLAKGQVLSVNGPPGTGKTTLLQSVVAHIWVEAALSESECPLIVVTSTNVKAVENVLDSFSRIGKDTGHQRWHPYDRGFGLFLASRSRATQHPTCTSDAHPYAEYETAEGLRASEQFFLARASTYFSQEMSSVAVVVNALHQRLRSDAERMGMIVTARFAVYRATGQGTGDGAATSCHCLLTHYQEQIDAEHLAMQIAAQQLDACSKESKKTDEAYEETRREIMRTEKAWSAYLTDSPLWLDLFSFVPPIKRRRMARDRYFLMSFPLTAELQHRDDNVAEHFAALKKTALTTKSSAHASVAQQRITIEHTMAAAVRRRKTAEQASAEIRHALQQWQDALTEQHISMLDVSLDKLNDELDIALRAPMFSLADWYWSGKWLLEVKNRLAHSERDTKGRTRLEAKYRRFAKLSPCLVSNFHMAPSFFTAWQGTDIPLWNAIDLLIVDEAGQVAPDIAAPMFALAKRALVVGDTYQIEPVWNNGEATDRANAVKFGLTNHAHDTGYDTLALAGYTPASGNLMRIANRSCRVQKYDDMRGLMLTEHRRCVPQLVAYCNDLIYGGRLEPKRQGIPAADQLLPPFSYLNVSGSDKRRGGSRQNHDEAQAIVDWLTANRTRIEQHYAALSGTAIPLWKLVGIVTPFSAQAALIERLLRGAMPDLMRKDGKLTVGTVHALQGAERSIVIFSPTYGTAHKGGTFFDQKPNMLNVAVSRAKDSFLVIGNLALFDARQRSRPSGLLGSYLLNSESLAACDARVSVPGG